MTTRLAHTPTSKVIAIVAIGWTAAIAGIFAWNAADDARQVREVFRHQSRSFFQEIQTTRYWNAMHGRVYVPVTPQTPPNDYLDNPDRDVVTADGIRLTQINPAYMTRQIGELAAKRDAVAFHITSANPIRPANAPDPWEARALSAFSTGTKEYSALIDTGDGERRFRYMAPLWVEAPCLKCHAKQGYKEGDLRGGISVSIAAGPILAIHRQALARLSAAYGGIWAIGLIGVFLVWRRLRQHEDTLGETIVQLQRARGELTTLRGLLPICSHCKNIRDDNGRWQRIETYVHEHSDAEFSHSICPECLKKHYPDLNPRRDG